MAFNHGEAVMQYCNGSDWIGFSKKQNIATNQCSSLGPWTAHTSVSQAMGDYSWNDIAYGNGVFVAVGSWNFDNVLVSPDGISWTAHVVTPGDDWRSVAFGNGLFVAVGAGGGVRTSTDGVNWTPQTAAENNEWRSVVYGGGQFVAVAASGANRVMTSPDGESWAAHAAVSDEEWNAVTYGNGTFVAAARAYSTHPVMSSSDGVTWTPRAAGAMEDVTFGNGQFVGVIWGQSWTSPDGESWSVHNAALPAGTHVRVVYGGGRYLTGGMWGDPNDIYSSSDGVNWQQEALPVSPRGIALAYGNGRFVAIAANGPETSLVSLCGCTNPDRSAGKIVFNADRRVMQWCDGSHWHPMGPIDPGGPNDGCVDPVRQGGSLVFNAEHCILQYCDGHTWRGIGEADPCACDPDAGTWTMQSSPANPGEMISYGAGRFVIPDNGGLTSTDGINWTSLPDPLWAYDAAFGDGQWVAVNGNWNRVVYTSPDGLNWTEHTNATPNDEPWQRIAYGNGMYVAIVGLGSGDKIASSPDGTNWTGHGQGDLVWWDVTFGNGVFVVVSYHTSEVAVSADGVNWTRYDPTLDGTHWSSIAYGAGLFVAVGEDAGGNDIKTSPDGINWTSRSSTLSDMSWRAVAYGNGRFVALANSGAGNRIVTSPDGITWTPEPAPENNNWEGIAYGDGRFVAVSSNGTDRIMTATCLGGS